MTFKEGRDLIIRLFKVQYAKYKLTNNTVVIGYLNDQGFKQENHEFDIEYGYK